MLFYQTVSLPETLNQMPVIFNRKAFIKVFHVDIEFMMIFQTFRDAETYAKVQYDSQSLCQLAKLLRQSHDKISVNYNF